jgi:hypothetical protein
MLRAAIAAPAWRAANADSRACIVPIARARRRRGRDGCARRECDRSQIRRGCAHRCARGNRGARRSSRGAARGAITRGVPARSAGFRSGRASDASRIREAE